VPPRKGNGCSPQFPRDSVAAALAPPPLLKLTPHPLQGGHTLLPFHSIHRLPSKLLAQTMLSQGSSSFHACLPERHTIRDAPKRKGVRELKIRVYPNFVLKKIYRSPPASGCRPGRFPSTHCFLKPIIFLLFRRSLGT